MINDPSDLSDIDNNSRSRQADLDFLEVPYAGQIAPDAIIIPDMVRAINLLVREIRKMHPSQRCIPDIQWNASATANRGLVNKDDTARIFFKAEGKPVKSQYLVVANDTNTTDITVAVNEPAVSYEPTGDHGNGITLAAIGGLSATFVQLPVEIEFIEIKVKSAIIGGAVGINNSVAQAGIVTQKGNITVYAWTIPSANFEEISRNDRLGIGDIPRGNA